MDDTAAKYEAREVARQLRMIATGDTAADRALQREAAAVERMGGL